MPTKNEIKYAGEFMASEANGQFSRDAITIASGNLVNPGDVLGQILDGTATPAAGGGNTGTGTIGAVTLSQGAISGVYTLVCFAVVANLGKFILQGPTGIELGVVTTNSAFTGGGVAFTITDGGTHFVVGDTLSITVAVGSLKYVPFNPTAVDGSQNAAAIAYAKIDATGGDTVGPGITRHCEVNGAEIGWGTANSGQIAAGIKQLATHGIIVRTGSV